jgi:hypothetical protein
MLISSSEVYSLTPSSPHGTPFMGMNILYPRPTTGTSGLKKRPPRISFTNRNSTLKYFTACINNNENLIIIWVVFQNHLIIKHNIINKISALFFQQKDYLAQGELVSFRELVLNAPRI